MSLRKKCRICGHQLSLHEGAEATTPQPAFETHEQRAPVTPQGSTADYYAPEPSQPAVPRQVPAASVIDELTKLAALRRDDMITEVQFEALRDQLLSDPTASGATPTTGTPSANPTPPGGPIFVIDDSGELHDASSADVAQALEEYRSGYSSFVVVGFEHDDSYFAQAGHVDIGRVGVEVRFGETGEFLRMYPSSPDQVLEILTAWIDDPLSVLSMASWESVSL